MEDNKDIEEIEISTYLENVEQTEQQTEEQTEEQTEVDYSPYFEDIHSDLTIIKEMIADSNSSEIEENTSDPVVLDPVGLRVVGSGTGDFNLYLSGEVENANLNDIFSVGISIRNVLLVFLLAWLSLKLITGLKSVLYRLMNR